MYLLLLSVIPIVLLLSNYTSPDITDEYLSKEPICLPNWECGWTLYIIENPKDFPSGRCEEPSVAGCTNYDTKSIFISLRYFNFIDAYHFSVITHEILHASCHCNFHNSPIIEKFLQKMAHPYQWVMENQERIKHQLYQDLVFQ